MATVYLIAQPSVKRNGEVPDLKPLGKYGEVRVILNSGDYPALHPKRCLDVIEDKLKNFQADTDYLAWAGGDTLAAVMTGALLERMGVDSIKWLKFVRGWDTEGNRTETGGHYREVKVELYDEAEV